MRNLPFLFSLVPLGLLSLAAAPPLASAQTEACAPDELVVEVPVAPRAGEARATLRIAYSGDGANVGPDRGVCLRHGDSIEHIASGTVRSIRVPAARRALTTLRIGSRVVHVELMPGARVTLAGSTCEPWSLTGRGLDIVSATGTRPGAESALFLGAEGRLVPAQQGFCSPAVIVADGSEHVFFLRSAHTFRVDLLGSEVRTAPFDPRTLNR